MLTPCKNKSSVVYSYIIYRTLLLFDYCIKLAFYLVVYRETNVDQSTASYEVFPQFDAIEFRYRLLLLFTVSVLTDFLL